MFNVFNSIVASITGEFAFLALIEKPEPEPRGHDHRKKERVAKIREFSMPRAGFRCTMRGAK